MLAHELHKWAFDNQMEGSFSFLGFPPIISNIVITKANNLKIFIPFYPKKKIVRFSPQFQVIK